MKIEILIYELQKVAKEHPGIECFSKDDDFCRDVMYWDGLMISKAEFVDKEDVENAVIL